MGKISKTQKGKARTKKKAIGTHKRKNLISLMHMPSQGSKEIQKKKSVASKYIRSVLTRGSEKCEEFSF